METSLSSRYLDDLAAAYAELGDFKPAVKTQKRALKKCQDAEDKTKMEKRLALYESEQPYHAEWDA